MKTSARAAAVFAICLTAAFATASTVSEATAIAAASGFLRQSSVAARLLPGRAVASAEARGSLWIVALEPSGCVVVAGSDKCKPVVSFSSEDFAEPDVGSPLDVILRDNSAWVERKESDESAEADSGWAKLTATVARKAVKSAAPTGTDGTGYDPFVAPFLGATWHQTAPYNDLSPYSYFCGCMATAAGQELRYWRWPYRYEKFRQTTHGVRDAQNNYYDFVLRPNGLVPFDWDKIKATYSDETNASTPWAKDKVATYNAAYLSLWMQSMTGMGYKPGGSGGTRQLASEAENYWYEHGTVMTYWSDGYTNLWNAVKADLDWGSPIQINTAAHQMVIDGYAVENYGQADEVDYINLNLGYGNAVYWANLKTAVTTGTYSGVLAAFQTGYRPQKIVQFEPLPKVITNGTAIAWHIAPCYTNKISAFLVQTSKDGVLSGSGVVVASGTERNTYETAGLENGGAYTFTVTPVMSDASSARANSVSTTVGTPQPSPEILSVSSVACGIELVQQDIFVECARGITNQIKVTCSESTTSLTNYSSHLTILPDNKISVTKDGNVFTVNVDACDMAQRWNVEGEMIILTMVAANADGTETAKNLMLRFNSMRQVLGGTFEIVEPTAVDPVWFCGNTTLDAKGKNVVFASDAFQGNGYTVTLVDSAGGGSFAFAGIDNYKGTLAYSSDVAVTLPSDMSNFTGTISLTDGIYNLCGTWSADATINLSPDVTNYLVNADVASAVIGGTVVVTNGNTTLSGKVTSNVILAGGSLTIPAGDSQYSQVFVKGGTLKVTLSKAQSILGYDWWLPFYESGTVKFVLYDGSEVEATMTAAAPGKTISLPSEANVWTGEAYALFGDKYSAKWSNGLPAEGDYVRFVSALDDSDGTFMRLDLSSPRNLGYILVTGVSKLEIGNYNTDTTALLTADVFENQVETHITTTYFQPKTVIPKAKLSTSSGFVLTCDLDYKYADNLKRHETGGSALTSSDYWQGRVIFSNCTKTYLNVASYGNALSTVMLSGVTGSFEGDQNFLGTLELLDAESAPAMNCQNGPTSINATFAQVIGDGTFKTSGSSSGQVIIWKDVSKFAGSLDLSTKTLAIADEKPASNTGDGKLHLCKPATIAEGKSWSASGGFYLGTGGNLTVNGTLVANLITVYGEGSVLTLEDGGTVAVSSALFCDYAPTLNFKAGTYKFTGDSSVTETRTVNFCAADGKCTTIDAGGRTITLGPNFFSGSGDVYLTSSASGGAFVMQGVSSAYTGTIYADISAGVTISGDLSSSSGKISFSDISLSVPSTSLGNVDVGSGGTLVVTVSKSDRIKGLVVDSVNLVDGGTLVLQDTDGKTLATFAAADAVDGKYTLDPAPDVEPVCILDYEFNGNVVSTGSDNNATLHASSTITYYDSSALYTKCTPWINKEFAMPDDEWTAVVRGTLPAANSAKPTMVLMFGTNGGNIFGLVAGTEENTVAIADRSGIIGTATAVTDATTKYHVYTIVKTAGRVRLYVDDELKVDEAKAISVPKKFQFGSVHGGNNSSYAACTGDDSRIDWFKFYDFAAGLEFIESLLPEEEPEPVPALAIPGTVSQEAITFTNVFLDASEEWAVIGDKPIFFTVPSQTNVFTVAFDAYVPNAAGTVFGFEVSNSTTSNEIKARRTDDGTVKGLHSGYSAMGSDAFTGGTTVLTPGAHRIMVEYDHRNGLTPASIRGTTIYVDGTNVYHSKGLSWSGRMTTLFAIGGAAITNTPTDVLTGLKVKNLTFIDGMFKDQATGADSFATVNGTAASSEANLEIVRLFGLTPENREVTFAIDAIDLASGVLLLDVSPAVANGSLSVLAKESLADENWTRAKVLTGADAKGGAVSLDDEDLLAYRFFQIRAEAGVQTKGTTVR